MKRINPKRALWLTIAFMLSSISSLMFAEQINADKTIDISAAEGNSSGTNIKPPEFSRGDKLLSYFGVGKKAMHMFSLKKWQR